MTNLTEVYALNVNLFAFQLQSGLQSNLKPFNNPPTIIEKLYQPIFEHFQTHFNQKISLPEIRQECLNLENFDLLNTKKQQRQYYQVFSNDKNGNPEQPKPLYGLLLYPQKITDGYTLLLNIFRPQQTGFDAVKTDEIDKFNPENCLIIQDQTQYSQNTDFLGQTFLITAFLPAIDSPNFRQLAHELRQDLLGDFCSEFYQDGNFLDSYICEFSHPKNSKNRVLILFYSSEDATKQMKLIYWELSELFLYYHKIISTFQFSRDCSNEADELIRDKIETELTNFLNLDKNTGENFHPNQLNQLEEKLNLITQIIPQYALKIRNLEYALNTIIINHGNYQKTLKRLQAQSGESLDFFARFIHRECDNFQFQIQADLNYFKPASNLLDQTIASIRGLVEVEQAKREKSLQKTIEALGIGIGAGGIFASATSGHITSVEIALPIPHQHCRINLPAGLVSVTSSFIVAIVGGVIVAKVNGQLAEWLSPWHKWRQSRLNSSNHPELPAPSTLPVNISQTETEKEEI